MNDNPYRAIICAVIEQAYHDATSNNITIQDCESAKAYLHDASTRNCWGSISTLTRYVG